MQESTFTAPPPLNPTISDLFELSIPLPDDKMAYLRYDRKKLNKKDIMVIRKAIEFIEISIPDEEITKKRSSKAPYNLL
jgi:hypothetical protein